MRSTALLVLACSIAACVAPKREPDYGRALRLGAPALIPLGPGESPPSVADTWTRRDQLLPALERSLEWTASDYARQFFPQAGISHGRALASLERFRELLITSNDRESFDRAVQREFQFYKSAGWDGRGGGVLFTGYCTPILIGSLRPDATFRYPLYALPPDLVKGPHGEILGRRVGAGVEPYPTRRAIEAGALLADKGLELVWLRDRIDSLIAHVNGSAFIELPDGSMIKLGYAGKNGQPYTSIGAELVADGKLAKDSLSLPTLRRFFRDHPELVDEYVGRNESYVFFTPIDGTPRGSLNLEVSPEITLATDKRLFPRGALVFVDTALPRADGATTRFQRMMLDQDTGGAIRTAGRADIYLGIGPEAERRAGTTRAEGQMYYAFLRRDVAP